MSVRLRFINQSQLVPSRTGWDQLLSVLAPVWIPCEQAHSSDRFLNEQKKKIQRKKKKRPCISRYSKWGLVLVPTSSLPPCHCCPHSFPGVHCPGMAVLALTVVPVLLSPLFVSLMFVSPMFVGIGVVVGVCCPDYHRCQHHHFPL
jgi:hypothetical protein